MDASIGEIHPVAYARLHAESVNSVIDPKTGKKREYRHLVSDPETKPIWDNLMYCELGRLVQGTKEGTVGTETLRFVSLESIPKNRKITYLRILVDIRERKEVKERVRITVGGDKVDYPGEVTT